jgi:hypothetical protein
MTLLLVRDDAGLEHIELGEAVEPTQVLYRYDREANRMHAFNMFRNDQETGIVSYLESGSCSPEEIVAALCAAREGK